MTKKIKSRYSASFTAGSLLHKETTTLLKLLQSENSHQEIREEIKQNNILHINSESSRKRVVAEIIKRTKSVDASFWDIYKESTEEEQKMHLFYLCLKTYYLLFDFHFNVTLKEWNSSSQKVDPYYYQMELGEIALREEVVDKWTDNTKQRTIDVYLRILKDIRMLNRQNQIQKINMTDSFWNYYIQNNEIWFLDACLLNNHEKERLLEL